MTFLWTGGGDGAPDELIDLVLCRDIFHCRPSELDTEDDDRIRAILAVYNAEGKVKEMRSKKPMRKGKKGG